MKRILSSALTFCMVLSLFTVGVSADAPDPTPELAQRTYAILSEQRASVTIKAPCAARVLFAVYDARGRMLGVSVSGEVAAGESVDLSVSCVPDKVASGKAFFLDDSWRPAAEALDVSIPVVSMNEAFGLRKDLRFVENPRTEAELADNVLWCFAHGQYAISLNLSPDIPTKFDYLSRIHAIAGSLPELVGMYGNQPLFFRCVNNKLVLWVNDSRHNIEGNLSNCPALEPAECYERQKQAYFKALEIHDQLHESGKITDSMTQREIAQVYYNYMAELRETMRPGYGHNATIEQSIIEDSAYGALCYKMAACGGRAAALNMLLHTEGIACCGLCGRVIVTNGEGGGHGVSYMILDGDVYLGDWGNLRGIEPPETFYRDDYSRFEAEPISLAAAERVVRGDYSGMVIGAPMTVKVAGAQKLSVTLPDIKGADTKNIDFSIVTANGLRQVYGSNLTISGETLTINCSSISDWNSVQSSGKFMLRVKSDTWYASGITR